MKLLKVLMQVIAAIWGVVFVVIFPVMMLLSPQIVEGLPTYVPLLWLVTAVVGFVVPCFLVQFKFYKTSAVICSVGAVALLFVHGTLPNNNIAWFYLPLLLEMPAAIAIAAIHAHKKQKEYNSKPAQSVLNGATPQTPKSAAGDPPRFAKGGEPYKPKYERKKRKK